MPQPLTLKKLRISGITRHSRTNTPQKCTSHHRGLECKSRKWRDTWSNRQVLPWSIKWCKAKANKVLPKELTGYSKHSLSTMQKKTLHIDITKWTILKSDWLYSLQLKMEKLCRVSKNKTESWLWLRSWIHYCKTQISMEESRESNKQFKYDLNQIPYVYTLEVTKNFKGLDLIEHLNIYGQRLIILYRR